MKIYVFLLLGISLMISCTNEQKKEQQLQNEEVRIENPAAIGFNENDSDEKAIRIADEVMVAMGGRKNWDRERYFKWNFFGARTLWWDKWEGDVRIQMHNEDSAVFLVNIFDDTGKVFAHGKEETQADSIAKYLNQAKGIWINDAYWLFMPFKLKDSGVTLKYVGVDTTQSGLSSDVLQLSFKDVGNTPQNKYHVWVDQSDKLVKQWAFYRENDLVEPNFITPWIGYKKHNTLLLAGDRGRNKITDIEITDHMDQSIFTEF